MFDFLTFSAISDSAADFLDVVKVPIAVLLGVGLCLMVASWILAQFGIGSGGSPGLGGDNGRAGAASSTRRSGSPRAPKQSASDREWAMLEQNARDVNGWDG